jgi:hypothetical protein
MYYEYTLTRHDVMRHELIGIVVHTDCGRQVEAFGHCRFRFRYRSGVCSYLASIREIRNVEMALVMSRVSLYHSQACRFHLLAE